MTIKYVDVGPILDKITFDIEHIREWKRQMSAAKQPVPATPVVGYKPKINPKTGQPYKINPKTGLPFKKKKPQMLIPTPVAIKKTVPSNTASARTPEASKAFYELLKKSLAPKKTAKKSNPCCPECKRETSTSLDMYYGRTPDAEKYCSDCRKKKFNE